MTSNRSDRGAILLQSILVFAALVLVGILVISSWSVFRYIAARNDATSFQAVLWADSGIDDALNQLSHNPFWRADGSESFPLLSSEFSGGDGYEVRVEPLIAPDRFLITSTGRAGGLNATRSQETLLLNPFLFTLIALEDIDISGDARIDGHVSSRESVRLSGPATVSGVVQAGRNFSGASAQVFGGIHEHLKMPNNVEFNEIGPAYLALRPNRLFGGQISNLMSSDTLLWIAGSSEVTGLQVEHGTVIVSGDLRIRGPVSIEASEGMAALIVVGNIRVEDKGNLRAMGLVFATGSLTNAGRCNIDGTAIARRIETGSDFRIRPNLAFAYSGARGFPDKIVRRRYSIVR